MIDVQYASQAPDLPHRALLTTWVNSALKSEGSLLKQKGEMTIRIVDESEAKQLNKRWRQRPYPTNVLSFPFECPPGVDIPLLGDIVICAPLVAREAADQQKSLHAHWAHLVIHGTLHLLGYDHISEQEAQIMESLEIQILHELGYSNPYQIAL